MVLVMVIKMRPVIAVITTVPKIRVAIIRVIVDTGEVAGVAEVANQPIILYPLPFK
jgi:hypothetical protein